MKTNPTVFISYSWENEEHKKWVKNFASRLRKDGVDAKLDQWDVIPGDMLPNFMEKSIRDIDYVLIICTPKYKIKSDLREGGVGYEGDIITGEIFQKQNNRKFIPILRKGEWNESSPSWISGKYYIDLRDVTSGETNYRDLITTILNTREPAPTLAQNNNPKPDQSNTDEKNFSDLDDITIKGILVDEIEAPSIDRSRGSALYKIPFELSRHPDSKWAELFKQTWNKPPQWTSMHRPGIGYVIGNRIFLDGTTIEEVKKYHRDTLILVVTTVNKHIKEIKLQERIMNERIRKETDNRRNNIRDVADDIKF